MSERIVVVPTDLSDESLQALAFARQVFGGTNLSLHLVYVLQLVAPVGMPRGSMPLDWIGDAEGALTEILPTLEIKPSATAVRVGHPATEIVRYAEAVHAEAISMMTHGRRGVERFFMGSTAEEVVRTSNVPVLISRPPAAVSASGEQPVERAAASAPRVATFKSWLERMLRHQDSPTVGLEAAFQISLEMEARARDLYKAFARRFVEDLSVVNFFTALSADEDLHYNAVLFVRNVLKEVPPRSTSVEMNLERMQKLADLVDGAMARLEQPEFTMDEAVRITEEIEMSEMDQVLETLTHLPSHPVIIGILDDMKRGHGEHALRLFEFLIYHRSLKK